MPGLAGIVQSNADNRHLLDKMINSMRHRQGYRLDSYHDSFFDIARLHLGIFNPESQPIFNEDNSLCIFMEGKIYGYEHNLDRLRHKGHILKADNDAEFCLHFFEERGEDFAKELNGSFILVICNLKEKRLLVVNDRYGLRPLYYAVNDNKLLFASEVKAILEDRSFKRQLNDETIVQYLVYGGEVSGNKTFFNGIEVLPPASIFNYQDGKFSIKQYWDFDYQPDYSIAADEYAEQLAAVFSKAVNIRVRGNLRCGLELSGGLDSRLIVAAMDAESMSKTIAYTFGAAGCSEYRVAHRVTKELNMKHVFCEYNPDEAIPYSKETVYIRDGFGTMSVGPIFHVEDTKIANNADVLINGTPGDLTLGGGYLNQSILAAKSNEELFLLLETRRQFPEDMVTKLFASGYYAKVKHMPLSLRRKALNESKGEHPGNRVDYFFLQNRERRVALTGDILSRVGHETASPFYDNHFVDVILKTPPEWRLNHRLYVKVLKRLSPQLARIPYEKTMVRADAPLFWWRMGSRIKIVKLRAARAVRYLSRGRISLFSGLQMIGAPEWIKTNENWKELVAELLLSKEALSREYLNTEFVGQLVKEHQTSRLLRLMSFELFLRFFTRRI